MKPTLTDTMKLAYSAEEPSAAIADAVADLAAGTDLRRAKRRLIRRRLRLSFGGISLAAAVTAGFAVEPRIAFSMLLRKVHARLDGQSSVHYKLWTIMPNGSRVVSQELWHHGGADRIERGGGREVILVRGESRWVYDASAKTVLTFQDDPNTRRFGSFSGTDLLRELENSSWLDKVETEDLGDQTVTSVTGKTERTRIRLWIDKASDLPQKIEIQTPKESSWLTVQEGTFDFSLAASAADTATGLPKGIPVIDAKDARDRLQAKWQVPLFSYRSTHIYDVQANDRGDVFVIYSGENILLESDGVTYANSMSWSDFWPTTHTTNSDAVDGFTSPNGNLRGKIFTPVRRGPWRPAHLRITCVHPSSGRFTADEGALVVRKDGKRYYTWSLQDMARAIEKHEQTAPDRAIRTFKVLITNPNCATLPTYMPLMPMGPRSVTELDEIEADARAKYFKGHQLFADAEREIRTEIREFDLKCLESGSPGVQPQAYMDLYEVLAAEGKRDEALAALKAVPDQMVYKNDDLQRRLDEAYAKEGLR